MKKANKGIRRALAIVLLVFLADSCRTDSQGHGPGFQEEAPHTSTSASMEDRPISDAFRDYWYAGEAEITSYRLKQARYGQLRDGHAVLIFVTEPFVPGKQVKADRSNADNVSVLKLNSTKKYLTGIYPYSIMTSTFQPVRSQGHSLKVTFSAQEWCGHVFAQLNNRDQFEIASYSYFESDGDQVLKLGKTLLEDEVWNLIRIDPGSLPIGEQSIIPSFEYIRLAHKDLRAYNARTTLNNDGTFSIYEISYPELGRTLNIQFSKDFPHTIEGWSETSSSGFGNRAEVMTSTATRMERLKIPYWEKNDNKDLSLRDSLAL